jgi:tyrosinase
MLLRSNVWELGSDWAGPILWYARGVEAMKARPLVDPTSWRFYAAMHGLDQELWQQLGYWDAAEPKPKADVTGLFWKQCQHGSWYFLPWHRGYLLAFEATIRAAVVRLGGPADWTLPYWNYFKTAENALPRAFASPDWPDGKGDNPLFVPQRYGPNNDGNVFVVVDQVNLDAMSDPDFTGVASGGSPGFGGVDTGFSHGGHVHGGLETQPHDWVHGLVGGSDPKSPNPQLPTPGLMSDPDTAGLDPIFWLHHANIDRLWEVWRENPPSDADPTDANWIKGPANVGDRAFAMPMPDTTTWTYTPGQMVDLASLGYSYDDLSPAVAPTSPDARIERLRVAAVARGAKAMTADKTTELVGATRAAVPVKGAEIRASVQLDPKMRRKVVASLVSAAVASPPDRVFLNLENVRGQSDATAFHVYVGRPQGAGSSPGANPGLKAGSISLFGVRKASLPTDAHGGQGLTFVLEITKIIDALHLDNAFDVDSLDVRLVPVRPVPDAAQVSIGRISVVRQGGG